MSTWMALFGMFWMLRLRDSLRECEIHNETTENEQETCSPTNHEHDQAPFEVIPLHKYKLDASVQTDFDDDEDFDKIEHERDAADIVNERVITGRNLQNVQQSPRNGQQEAEKIKAKESDIESDWETVEVCLERGSAGLGLSIVGGEAGGDVCITRIAESGAAKKDGRLQIVDILVQVNDSSVENVPHSVAVSALQNAGNHVKLKVHRAKRPRVITLWRGTQGLGIGIAGGADLRGGGSGIFVSHIAVSGAAHNDGRIRLGDRILAVRDEDNIETSLIGVTHAKAVAALKNAGEKLSLVVLPAAAVPSIIRNTSFYSTKSQATSCSTLHELLEEQPANISRCVRMVRLIRTGSRLGMDIVGGLGVDSQACTEDNSCGVFVSNVSAEGSAFGLLHKGDRILNVDGRDLTNATHEQAAASLKFSGNAVMITAQYQPEQYERLRARIRAINSIATQHSRPHTPVSTQGRTPVVMAEVHAEFQRK